MTLGRSLVIARQDWRVLRRESIPVMVLVVMPLLLMPFMKPAFKAAFVTEHIPHANGAEQAVPGMAVTFAFFLIGNMSFAFFREHAWNTWERLRASPATSAEIMLGKVMVPLLQAVVQFALLFSLGGLLLGLHIRGSWVDLIAIGAAFSVYLVATGLAVIAICRTFMQANAFTNIGALLLAGLGGALVPQGLLPHWAQTISPVVPSYWAMRGYRHVILGQHGGVLLPVAVLLAFAVAHLTLAGMRFRLNDRKTGLV